VGRLVKVRSKASRLCCRETSCRVASLAGLGLAAPGLVRSPAARLLSFSPALFARTICPARCPYTINRGGAHGSDCIPWLDQRSPTRARRAARTSTSRPCSLATGSAAVRRGCGVIDVRSARGFRAYPHPGIRASIRRGPATTAVPHRRDYRALFRAGCGGSPWRPAWVVPCAAAMGLRQVFFLRAGPARVSSTTS